MPTNFENTALIQLTKGNWKFRSSGSETHTINWKDLLIDNTKQDILEAVKEQLSTFSQIIVLPDSEILNTNSDRDIAVLITKGTKHFFSELCPELSDSLWEVFENSTSKGRIDCELTEPEINKALRFIFNRKPSLILICLSNSIFNSLHAKNLQNVLSAAGYKAQISTLRK